MESSQLTPEGRSALQFIEFDASEQVACEIKKHPFGALLILLGGLLVCVAILAATMLAIAGLNSEFLQGEGSTSGVQATIGLIGGVLIAIALVLIAVTLYLYRKNRVLVTNQKIAEVLFPSIFNRSITQFSLEDIQNVTVRQNGLFPRMLNYGTLLIETAGETENLTFTYTPLPFKCAREIEAILEQHRPQHVAPPQPIPPAPVPTPH